MIVVIDVGNTHTVFGVFQQGALQARWRFATDVYRTSDEYAVLLRSSFQSAGLTMEQVKGSIVATVVPPLLRTIQVMCKALFGHAAVVVGPGIRTGLNIMTDHPSEVGADRIVNAVAALTRFPVPLIIIDFGTATTFCYINAKRQYMGGVILPGLQLSADALYEKASKLTRTELTRPLGVIGKNTTSSLQSGLYYGGVGQVEGIVSQIKEEANAEPTVVATGGLSTFLAKDLPCIDVIDPHLTLKGLYDLYVKNERSI
ncbi:type III pantothenate kinase [Bacillaceae bacterium SIJ1]|uniref:type III pantothenate kinase n=1 Tax=Litoribacterium kuwaitense TaxID=1398745 RepID=UPI0013ED9524|nr:type III pantothenate kinase [Litoribacterium kuwaitense]NGP45815.1 type III pantothenate kinase [Litoribacterium kuwaitense]